jgi:TRAP-type C4-dicarboxylate transport system permease small subunit
MQAPLKWFGSIARVCAIVAGWALMAISVAMCVEILGRKYFNFSLEGLDEIGGYMLAGVCAFGFAYTLSTRSHMRVTLLFPYVPASVQSLLNVLAMLTLAAMAAFCAWRGVFEVLDVLNPGSIRTRRSRLRFGCRSRSGWPAWCSSPSAPFSWRCIPSPCCFATVPCSTASTGPQSLEEEISMEIGHAEAREGINKASRT